MLLDQLYLSNIMLKIWTSKSEPLLDISKVNRHIL